MAFITHNGVTIHYRLTGPEDGLPLILVNSLGTDLRIWEDVLPYFGAQFRVLTYDKRGHGLSDAPAGPYSLDDHLADLLALARHAQLERFAICGISVGGMIAMRIASTYPRKIRALILCDTAALVGTADFWNERIAAVEAGGMAAISETVMARWVSPGYRTSRPADYVGWRNMLERCPVPGYVGTCATVRDADLRQELPRINSSTLVITGEHDVTTPPKLGRELAGSIRGARFELIENAGHVPAIEQPAALAHLIRNYFDEVIHDAE